MIFIAWYVFIWIDTVLHWFLINRGIDPTPDSKGWRGSLAVNSWRVIVFIAIGLVFKCHSWVLYTSACYLMFLLFFSEQLNLLRPDKKLGHLGSGPTDSIMKLFHPAVRYSILTTLSAILIYLYYA